MSGFVSLGHAARLLAGENANDAGAWLELLEGHADDLKAVKRWSDHGNQAFPGGVSYHQRPAQWRIPFASFMAWCDVHGYHVSREENPPPGVLAQTNAEPKSRRARQIARIMEAISAQGWNAMCIPAGGKQKIKAHCLAQALFTDSAFARAWQAAINTGLLRMENHDTYARR